MNILDQLKKYTKVVADTSDFQSIAQYSPQDATTNPSLILASIQKEEYKPLLKEASKEERPLEFIFVAFGKEILKRIEGRVSIEVDARLSFDTKATIERAKYIIALFEKERISRKRILIKIASTWEGIKAAKELEKENIHCNMTLLFSLIQAIGAAEAKATLISPFVGRILDWYKARENRSFLPHEDPGVLSVTAIYNYYKKFNIETEIMGASFRSIEQILELSGCDLLTISPSLLKELNTKEAPLECKLTPERAKEAKISKIELTESNFRYLLNQDAMAHEKLSEGIRLFVRDIIKLEECLYVST